MRFVCILGERSPGLDGRDKGGFDLLSKRRPGLTLGIGPVESAGGDPMIVLNDADPCS